MAERVFAMPDLGEGLEGGEIVAWLVSEGDAVVLNQPLAEIETAKATVEIPSPFGGTIRTLHGDVGESVAVGAPLVTFARVATPTAATPAVRKLAREHGVDLSEVAGTGPDGRITADDVGRAAAGDGTLAIGIERDFDVEAITIARRTIAERLTASVREVPHVTTFRTLDCSALTAVRTELDLSPLPLFVKALAVTCREHPVLHSSWHGDRGEIHVPHACHVGIAADTPKGLAVPVLRDAAGSGIAEIDAEIRRLAAAAREGSLTPDELTGATISVSNTGSYGSESGTPIIPPGQGAVIAMGAIAPRALVVGGDVVARPACTLSLSFDHRLMDGATAGRALTFLIELLGDEDRMRGLA